MKAPTLMFSWFLSASFIFHTSSCSNSIVVNNAATTQSSGPRAAENQNAGSVSNKSQTVESSPSQNPKDVVLFDGKNYIKKSGWKAPSRKETFVDESYDGGPVERMTTTGKQVKTTSTNYIYNTQWLYSQNFYFEGRDLDYMKGKLKAASFIQMSVNGKVFFYSVFGEKVVPPPTSNSDPHEDPFRYQIMDADGDGIFETLLGDYDEIIVPDWVLK